MAVIGERPHGYDLHMHTTASDGWLTPEDCMALAKRQGLRGAAVTDHDTTAGVEAAVRAGQKLGVEIVPGVEISAMHRGHDIHILGLWIDPGDPLLSERLAGNRDVRRLRNVTMLEALRRLGFDVTLEEAERIAASRREDGDRTVGRPHIAELLVAKGYVTDLKEAFDLYLAEGAKAYVASPRVSPEEAARWIREAGGVVVVAHPGLYRESEALETIERLHAAGMLDGIEAGHADHGETAERLWRRTAERLGVPATAGSDFHGIRGGEPFHAMLGSRRTEEETVERLLQIKKKRGNYYDS